MEKMYAVCANCGNSTHGAMNCPMCGSLVITVVAENGDDSDKKTYSENGWGEQVGSFCPFCGESGPCQC